MPPKPTKRNLSGRNGRSTTRPYPATRSKGPESQEYNPEGSFRRNRVNNYADVPDPGMAFKLWPEGDPRHLVREASRAAKQNMARHRQQTDNLASDLLSSLVDAADSSPKGRPAAYTDGIKYLEQCRNLLKLYDEHNADVMGPREDKAPEQWEKEVELVSKTLDNGVSYGMDLVDAMLQPSLEPQLPVLDESQAQDTEKAAVDMFEGHGLSTDTWGRSARVFLDGWSNFLQTPSMS